MGILIFVLKLFGMWSVVSTVAALGLGAAIARGERIRKDQFLTYVFASIETLQTTRGY
jgi:hypothetical protein